MKKGLWLAVFYAAAAFGYTVQVDTGDVNVRPAGDPAFLGYDVVSLEGGGVTGGRRDGGVAQGYEDRVGGRIVRRAGGAARVVPRNTYAGADAF